MAKRCISLAICPIAVCPFPLPCRYPLVVSKKPSPDIPPSFEDAIAEVEAIIERIEAGQVGLEESLAQYERGVTLINQCRQTLSKAGQVIEDLSKKLDQDE